MTIIKVCYNDNQEDIDMKNELENIYHSRVNNLNFLLVDIIYRKPHLHFDLEISFILEGSGFVKTQGNKYKIKMGQAIIFNSCQTHEFLSDKSLKMLVLQINTTILDNIFPTLNKIIFEAKPFNLADSPELFYFTLQSAINYFEESAPSPLKIFGYTSLMLDYLISTCNHKILNATQQNKQIDLQERILRISSYIYENYTTKVTLEDLAQREGFSRTYFSHFFKNNFGITFKEYLENLRCEKAKLLLSSTSESLLSVCYDSGFSDTRTLNNSFMKSYGISPKEYRKSIFPTPISSQVPFNQDEMDNQRIYNNQESLEHLTHLFKEKFDTFIL